MFNDTVWTSQLNKHGKDHVSQIKICETEKGLLSCQWNFQSSMVKSRKDENQNHIPI